MPLNKIEINSYYSRIGYLPQHSILFKGTVKENILLGEEKSLDDKLLEFLDYL
ncbi:MAG: transporter, partial [Thermosipho sp. (in: Bacteria)]|nr:transporter [Thermosipho sp. (in: thermotogales)]